MTKKLRNVFSLFLITTMLSSIFTFGAFAADAPGGAPGGMPGGVPSGGAPSGMPSGGMPGGAGGMPGMPGGAGGMPEIPGGMPSMPGAPSKAAIFIENGAEAASKEYTAGQYKAFIKSDAKGITIQGLDLSSGDYTFDGIAVGAKSIVTLDKCKIKLGVTKEADAKATGGAALSVSDDGTVYVKNSELVVDGAQRYVTNTSGNGKLIVNDSSVTQTGSNQFTTKQTEPFSNDALLISGIARANMSTGSSHTYYFNSKVTTEGWAALSTDASSGLDLYAYNSKSIAQHGGYGTFADFDCRVWLYGSTLESAEIGAIISKSGQVTVADGASAPADVVKYNTGKTTAAGSVITGGRNAVMLHAPDMMGQGKAAADCGILSVTNSTLATSRNLKSTRDYAKHISKAVDAYINYTMGAVLLVKSTSANINFDNAKFDSFSGVAIMTVLNSDKWGNFLKAESDGAEVKPIAVSMKNMTVNGDVKHMDYQRIMTLSLDNAVILNGAVVSGTVEEWNKLWASFKKEDCKWVQNDSWKTYYGVKMTVKKGATWNVTGASTLSSLTVENGGMLKGKVQVDGKTVIPAAGAIYTGKITVTPM
jgi:hypothetical protein